MQIREPRSFDLGTILKEIQAFQHTRAESLGLAPGLARLREWQAKRLARTYSDLAEKPQYRDAMAFFLTDLYAARDFSQRNQDLYRMYDLLRRVVPESMLRPLILTIDLHAMTEALDERLLAEIEALVGDAPITLPIYAQAYRQCDNYPERARQIEVIYDVTLLLDAAVHHPMSGTVLRVAYLPMKKAGWGELSDLAGRGYKAFRQLPDIPQFAETIREREMLFLDRIYQFHPDPYGFGEENVS